MNFSKHSIQKKRKALSAVSSGIGNSAGVTFLRFLLLGFVTLCVAIVCFCFGAFHSILDNAPAISDVNIMPIGNATFVYDADGNQLQKLSAPTANRMSVSIEQIPLDMQHAIVAIEDERFYEHNGIDVQGILRAFVNGVAKGFHFHEGASTLTQQLLKNNVFTNWTNEGSMERFRRKIQEQYLAQQLEASLTASGMDTKSVILENYLNTINFSAGTYGVQAASQRYFGKDCNALTVSECAVLAAIPQNPYAFNPIRHPEKNAERRYKVLTNMKKQGYIDSQQYEEALADNVYERIQETDSSHAATSAPYSYFIDELTSQITNDLQSKLGYTKIQAQTALYSGGLRIYTTQDPGIQQILDEEYTNEENFPANIQIGLDWALTLSKADGTTQNYSREMMKLYFRDHGEPNFDLLFSSEEQAQGYVDQYKAAIISADDNIVAERVSFTPQPQSSMVIMDQHTGYVKAIVGGRGKKTASLTLNRATNTYRQPGSTFKPLAVYGPAMNDYNLTLADYYDDHSIVYQENNKPVKNAYSGYRGFMNIRDALKVSCNTIAIQCFWDITPRLGYDYLKRLGFEKVTDHAVIGGKVFDDAREPTALGGITYGVSTLELTAAYAAIANKGVYTKPIFYTQVLDTNGNVILDNTPQTHQVFRESTAYLLTSAMQTVVQEGTAQGLALGGNIPVAGKTGTTSATRDVWFAGFTPYYTCAVWAGYDTNEFLENDAKSFHRTLWKKVMSRIHQNLPSTSFEVPKTVQKATICAETGLLAGLGCPTRSEYFDAATIPETRCTQHYVPPTPEPTPEPSQTPEGGGFLSDLINGIFGGGQSQPEPTPQPEEPTPPDPEPSTQNLP